MIRFKKSVLALTPLLLLAGAPATNTAGTISGGTLCVSHVLSKAPNPKGWQKKQFIQIDDGPKVDFTGIPKLAFKDLPHNKKMTVKIYWEDKVLSSWPLVFKEFDLADVYFRPGYWRMDRLQQKSCKDSRCCELVNPSSNN